MEHEIDGEYMIDLETLQSQACRGADCPSDFALEQYHLGELEPMERHGVEVVLKSCSDCQERFDTLKRGFEALPEAQGDALLQRILADSNDVPLQASIADAISEGSDGKSLNTPAENVSFWSRWLRPMFLGPLMAGAAALILLTVQNPTVAPATPQRLCSHEGQVCLQGVPTERCPGPRGCVGRTFQAR